ncbi:histidinol-phosphate transaminase [Sporosarcina sp.]|uniref:histidinol-phosphate transaminase n=1 Tax=Sporosarcina sp. TaxID=49982 RepID=UPI00262BA4D4|nr:histidinol-phosphate transaminase [Sporosarcina sp.]
MNWRTSVKDIAPYIPGKSIEAVKKELNLEVVHRLASNENPLGPSPKAKAAMKQAIEEVHLYPDASATKLRERLADLYEVRPEQVITGNGADNIISLVVSAYIDEGDEVVYGSPTFPAYRSSTLLMGGKPVEVPLTEDWKFDLDAIQAAITDKTKLVFICNPNNPTGTIVEDSAIEKFIQEVPDHVTVVLDEAYIEYIREQPYKTGIDYFKADHPIITIRTFSKFYSLAGLRVGYAIASEELLEPVLRLREPFAVNRVAIEAASATLDDSEFTDEHYQMNEEGKNYLTEEFTKLGFEVFPSYTNFLFVHIKSDAQILFNKLLEKGLIIRPCTPWGLNEYVRVSIGTKEQNELLVEILHQNEKE